MELEFYCTPRFQPLEQWLLGYVMYYVVMCYQNTPITVSHPWVLVCVCRITQKIDFCFPANKSVAIVS